ncbi:MAG: TonB-dependent receptor family protein [Bacteroidia bacterium]|nr:TonB-dependent receptor family protein [Bacteroidia bacterium]
MRLSLITLFSILCLGVSAQSIKLSGNIQDTTSNGVMKNSILMVTKFKDSTLVNYSRTDKNGLFKNIKVPVDTYLVVISNPNFSDKTYLLVPTAKDSVFNFKNVVLPPKSFLLNEVEIVASKEKMYYKGDTLMFTADSFKLKQDATVEDLLKKLPGVKVDAAGKITVQGKEVSQVLVDGDEFFGSDPTIATKNLNAKSVENVQVYEKKNEDAESQDETVKVLNLQLKEDAKKGYFGKASVASDFQKFYENELLLNRFKKNRKLSIFGLFANTPKQAFGGNDNWTYGLENENDWSYDPESNSWTSSGNSKPGVPQTLKGGFYYNDKLSKKIKLNTDYTFKENQLTTSQETNTQFFLEDTSYTNAKTVNTKLFNQTHNFNLRWVQNLDSLTELTVKPKINYNTSSNTSSQNDKFISATNELTRATDIYNSSKSETTDANVMIKLQRNFKKKDRQFTVTYQPTYYNSITKSTLNTDFRYYLGQAADSILKQKRTSENSRMEHNATVNYIEPLTKKFKVEIGYGFSHNENSSNRTTLDFDGIAFDALNTTQSNNFKNKRISNRAGGKLIYEVKKYRVSLGANYRNIYQENINVTTGQHLSLNVNNVLPTASFNYRPNQGSNLSVFYNMQSQLPDLKQMQPVIDNTDPNNISIGNPDLKQAFTNNVNMNYYFYKGISDINFYAGGNYNSVIGEINEKTTFDSIGRSITVPVNVDGNYFGNIYLGGGLPVFKKLFKIDYRVSLSHNNNVGFVNDQKNVTQNSQYAGGLTFEKEFGEDIEIRIGGDYNYNVPKQTISLQSNKPYYNYGLEAGFRIKLFERLNFDAEANYTNNGNRAVGYNIDYTIVNANISYSFLKAKNLILGIDANDILNQNINNRRDIQANKIVDSKTQIIRQYFLGRITYKFTSQKEKQEEEYD